jgi:hypothetical protein
MMRISICPIVTALTGGNIGQLADVSPAGADRGQRLTPIDTLLIFSAAGLFLQNLHPGRWPTEATAMPSMHPSRPAPQSSADSMETT